MLSWVAVFNSFPLVFPDTISYATTVLRGEFPGMFSVFYSLFILPLHVGSTLWPVVFVQGAIVGHLLYVAVRCVSGGKLTQSKFLLIVAALCLFSSLPWFTGQIMPDMFSAILIVSIFLLAFCTDQLTGKELIYLFALTTAGIATHLSHVPIACGLILLCCTLQPICLTTRTEIRRWAALLLAPALTAVVAMLAATWINSGTIALARNSNVFLLAKWLQDGPALTYLQEACPALQYSLCPYFDELKGENQDALKWSPGSPFYKVGGFDQLEPEARQIVWATLRSRPVEILQQAVVDVGQQLLRFRIGEGLTPEGVKLVAPHIAEVFGPDVENSLLQSRQAQGSLFLSEFRQLHLAALLLSIAFILWSCVAAMEGLSDRLVTFYIFVSAGIVWNAVVTGALSGPYDRYMARVSWLMCFVCEVSRVASLGVKHLPNR
jgi:hypothetical protein